jgi:multidrug resistance protein, MATE family
MVMIGFSDSQRVLLNMTNHAKIPAICQSIGIMCHIVLCYTFVYTYDLGISGAGHANSITNLIIYLSLLISSHFVTDLQEVVTQLPDARAIRWSSLVEYFSLGISSALMLCLEWWAFEVMSLIVGYIGVNE